jgi:hypothetical protein
LIAETPDLKKHVFIIEGREVNGRWFAVWARLLVSSSPFLDMNKTK